MPALGTVGMKNLERCSWRRRERKACEEARKAKQVLEAELESSSQSLFEEVSRLVIPLLSSLFVKEANNIGATKGIRPADMENCAKQNSKKFYAARSAFSSPTSLALPSTTAFTSISANVTPSSIPTLAATSSTLTSTSTSVSTYSQHPPPYQPPPPEAEPPPAHTASGSLTTPMSSKWSTFHHPDHPVTLPPPNLLSSCASLCTHPHQHRTEGRTHTTVEAGKRGVREVDLARTRAHESARTWALDPGRWIVSVERCDCEELADLGWIRMTCWACMSFETEDSNIALNELIGGAKVQMFKERQVGCKHV
ncbi:hypothetical protein C0995_008915 [Termitomyces sp. Mi166|nr:hypothetical protein C0995_008911 [Termitomyces sp. Mi166\